jgi:hypothetical protein
MWLEKANLHQASTIRDHAIYSRNPFGFTNPNLLVPGAILDGSSSTLTTIRGNAEARCCD